MVDSIKPKITTVAANQKDNKLEAKGKEGKKADAGVSGVQTNLEKGGNNVVQAKDSKGDINIGQITKDGKNDNSVYNHKGDATFVSTAGKDGKTVFNNVEGNAKTFNVANKDASASAENVTGNVGSFQNAVKGDATFKADRVGGDAKSGVVAGSELAPGQDSKATANNTLSNVTGKVVADSTNLNKGDANVDVDRVGEDVASENLANNGNSNSVITNVGKDVVANNKTNTGNVNSYTNAVNGNTFTTGEATEKGNTTVVAENVGKTATTGALTNEGDATTVTSRVNETSDQTALANKGNATNLALDTGVDANQTAISREGTATNLTDSVNRDVNAVTVAQDKALTKANNVGRDVTVATGSEKSSSKVNADNVDGNVTVVATPAGKGNNTITAKNIGEETKIHSQGGSNLKAVNNAGDTALNVDSTGNGKGDVNRVTVSQGETSGEGYDVNRTRVIQDANDTTSYTTGTARDGDRNYYYANNGTTNFNARNGEFDALSFGRNAEIGERHHLDATDKVTFYLPGENKPTTMTGADYKAYLASQEK